MVVPARLPGRCEGGFRAGVPACSYDCQSLSIHELGTSCGYGAEDA